MYFSGEKKKLKLTSMIELQKSVPNAQRVKDFEAYFIYDLLNGQFYTKFLVDSSLEKGRKMGTLCVY